MQYQVFHFHKQDCTVSAGTLNKIQGTFLLQRAKYRHYTCWPVQAYRHRAVETSVVTSRIPKEVLCFY